MVELLKPRNTQPQKNWHINPRAANATTGWGWYTGTGGNAGTLTRAPGLDNWADIAVRLTWDTRTANNGDVGLGLVSSIVMPLRGKRITAVFSAVASHAFVSTVGMSGASSGTATRVSGWSGTVSSDPKNPTRAWVTIDLDSTITSITSVRLQAGLPVQDGVWMEVSKADVYEGEYQPNRVPSDGDTPGWRWLGASGASASVGYPYTLESIAGAPLAMLDGPNLSSAALPLGSLDPFTGYVVGAVPSGVTNGDQQLASLGLANNTVNGGTGGLAYRSGGLATPPNRTVVRAQGIGAPNAWFGTVAEVDAPAYNTPFVAMFGSDGSRFWHRLRGKGAFASAADIYMASGMNADPMLRTGPVTANVTPRAAVVYSTLHNPTTQAAVLDWLARRYNVPLAV